MAFVPQNPKRFLKAVLLSLFIFGFLYNFLLGVKVKSPQPSFANEKHIESESDSGRNGESSSSDSDPFWDPKNVLWAYNEASFASGDWQEMYEIRGLTNFTEGNQWMVYSAFFDYFRSEHILRIVAVTPKFSKKLLQCHLFDKDLKWVGTAEGKVRTMLWRETWDYVYAPGFIICNLENLGEGFASSAAFVSLSEKAYKPRILTNLLKIENANNSSFWTNRSGSSKVKPKTLTKPKHKFGLCLQPMYEYDKALPFVQWVEFYRMMGVTHFTLYSVSVGEDVRDVIEYYLENEKDQVEIEVRPWTLTLAEPWVHANGQVAQQYDCTFRYRGKAEYYLAVDLDEYLLPNAKHPKILLNLSDLMETIEEDLERKGVPNRVYAQYQFRAQFFGVECNLFRKKDPKRESLDEEDILLYKHVQATGSLTEFGTRSKYISRPDLVVESGIHWMREAVGNAKEAWISEEIAFIRHFRDSKRDKCALKCGKDKPFGEDLLGRFYVPQLLERVKVIVKGMEKEKASFLERWRERTYFCGERGKNESQF